ncbi:hypothetical protein [Paenibacillus sp. FSL H8-0537]|uniref:hypothetical protein n=1 Tax=Paenibacillus sp. FSL H8-0537 TaxID=2921399 RepID=UPI00310122FB
MIYLGEKHIRAVGLHWQELAARIEDAVHVMDSGDYAQPVKPYLRLYSRCNVIITCTVSDRRYINLPSLPGSLLLDVSLRDYASSALNGVTAIIVDDWDEVCRENTDIELLHKERGLAKEGTRSLADVVCRSALAGFDPAEPVLFCPMGMAVFDIATADYWVQKARELGIGLEIDG